MSIRFPCPHCGAALNAPHEGASGRCPKCGEMAIAPDDLDDRPSWTETAKRWLVHSLFAGCIFLCGVLVGFFVPRHTPAQPVTVEIRQPEPKQSREAKELQGIREALEAQVPAVQPGMGKSAWRR